ncbi:hypothetical protein C9374_000790 [Naegleria lovaniensis]|uniref:RING-type domain-containing protein n=1 Tax=Naegleria lovaniensis TaxID=51637 RepID=A0AA88KLI4_NAELO|nr:uncharacterized protein C9374_000790 [Naegleria lovaniensis]KAG2387940.1 hypothetical protein C9374_000790 [Naegleria lovaniensis]
MNNISSMKGYHHQHNHEGNHNNQQHPSSAVQSLLNSSQISHADFECPLCLQLLYDPIGFHCGHSFCKFCIERLLASNGAMSACPCCRAPFCDSSNDTQLVTLNNIRPLLALKKVLPLLFGDEYKNRGEEVERERQHFLQTVTIRKKIYIGNLHALMNHRSDQNIHKWTFFVRMDEQDKIENYIESVEVKLHPTFKPSRLLLKTPPFELTRYGWGYFTIGVKITFKDYLNKPPFITSHTLSFDGNGDMASVEMDFLISRSNMDGLTSALPATSTNTTDMNDEED